MKLSAIVLLSLLLGPATFSLQGGPRYERLISKSEELSPCSSVGWGGWWLYKAIVANNIDTARRELKKKRFPASSLHVALLRCPDLAMLRFLLESGIHPDNVDSHYGDTALHARDVTVMRNTWLVDEEMVTQAMQLLIEYGASVNKPDRYEQTPLHYAARRGSVAHVRLLLEHEAEVDPESAFCGETPLMLAATSSAECVDVLIEAGADVTKVTVATNDEDASWWGSGDTALHFAARVGNAATATSLLAAGADLDAQNSSSMTPLLSALVYKVKAPDLALIRVLIEAGADRMITIQWGRKRQNAFEISQEKWPDETELHELLRP